MGSNVPGRFSALEVSENGTTYEVVRGVKNITRDDTVEEYNATDHDSEGEEYVPGLPSGMCSFELNAEHDDPGQIMLEAAKEDSKVLWVRFRRMYGAGQPVWTGRAFVTKFTDQRPKELATISCDLRISGKLTRSVQT